jgi:hypothetical protein
VTDYEKHLLNHLLSPDTRGFRKKRQSIEEHGTEEEREILAAWVKYEKNQTEQNSRDERINDIARFVLLVVAVAAVWVAISVLRHMWNHPLF